MSDNDAAGWRTGASLLRCPNLHAKGHPPPELWVRPSRTAIKFVCFGCGLAFSVTPAQLRRILIKRALE
jgi:hypothetical protein